MLSTFFHISAVVYVTFDTQSLLVYEGVNASVVLTASARGQFERPIDIAVMCNPTDAEGVVPGEYVEARGTASFWNVHVII